MRTGPHATVCHSLPLAGLGSRDARTGGGRSVGQQCRGMRWARAAGRGLDSGVCALAAASKSGKDFHHRGTETQRNALVRFAWCPGRGSVRSASRSRFSVSLCLCGGNPCLRCRERLRCVAWWCRNHGPAKSSTSATVCVPPPIRRWGGMDGRFGCRGAERGGAQRPYTRPCGAAGPGDGVGRRERRSRRLWPRTEWEGAQRPYTRLCGAAGSGWRGSARTVQSAVVAEHGMGGCATTLYAATRGGRVGMAWVRANGAVGGGGRARNGRVRNDPIRGYAGRPSRDGVGRAGGTAGDSSRARNGTARNDPMRGYAGRPGRDGVGRTDDAAGDGGRARNADPAQRPSTRLHGAAKPGWPGVDAGGRFGWRAAGCPLALSGRCGWPEGMNWRHRVRTPYNCLRGWRDGAPVLGACPGWILPRGTVPPAGPA